MTIPNRIKQLTDLGLVYNEKYRNFYHPKKGKIDHDVVVYSSDEEFEKAVKKLKSA